MKGLEKKIHSTAKGSLWPKSHVVEGFRMVGVAEKLN